jgi:hypothetical protein
MDKHLPRFMELIAKYKTRMLQHIIFIANGGMFRETKIKLPYYLGPIYDKVLTTSKKNHFALHEREIFHKIHLLGTDNLELRRKFKNFEMLFIPSTYVYSRHGFSMLMKLKNLGFQ